MKSSIQKLVLLIPFIKCLEAQFIPESEARLIAWRAYGDFVKTSLTAGVPLVTGKDYLFITPPNMAAIRGGTPCPDAVTNFDLYPFADGLQAIDEPLYNPQGPTYSGALYQYLSAVSLGKPPPTTAQLTRIDQLTTILETAQAKVDTELGLAYTRWLNDPVAQANGQTFAAWAVTRATVYNSAVRAQQTANANLNNYLTSVYGALHNTKQTQLDNIAYKAQDEGFSWAGYNMPVYPGTFNVQISPWAPAPELPYEGILYKPSYSLTGGFEEAADAWLRPTSPAPSFKYNWTLSSVQKNDWSTLGHSKTVTQIGGSAWWGLITAKRTKTSEVTVFNSYSSKFTTAISLELTMQGAPLVFNIAAGYWDVPGFRTTYPTLLSGEADPLNKKVRLQKLLLGYRVGLKITIKDTAMYQSIYQFIEDTKTSVGGGLSIFGFHFGASGGSVSHRNITDIQFNSISEGGTIIIPPSPPGTTFLLGALGKAQ